MARFTIVLLILAVCSVCIICTSACGPNSVYSDCASACPTTCKNMHDNHNGKLCPAVCVKGCKCINGAILNDKGRCVMPNEC